MKIKLDSKKCYLLAVSGGVDSCVLFDLLIKNNINFQVVHINHHTRGLENEQEQHLVEMMCQENQIKLHLYNYRHQDGNFQQKARLFRLNNYNNIIKQEKLDGVILAHHLDDQVENILMNSKKIGYKLMEEITNYEQIKIYRPLLNYLKKEIINYAKINNIKYLEDSSNKLEKYKRNYYRLNNNLSDDEKRLLVFNEKLKKDKIKLKNGHKKINRFFIDKKIPKEKRERWPIVVNKENKIIYVPKEIK